MKIESKSLVQHANAIVNKEISKNKNITHDSNSENFNENKLKNQYNSIKSKLYSSQYKITELQALQNNLEQYYFELDLYKNNYNEDQKNKFYQNTSNIVRGLENHVLENKDLSTLIQSHRTQLELKNIDESILVNKNIQQSNLNNIESLQKELQKLLVSLENISSLNYQSFSNTKFIEVKDIPASLFKLNEEKIKGELLN